MNESTPEQHAKQRSVDSTPRNEAREVLLGLRATLEEVHRDITELRSHLTLDDLQRAESILPILFNIHDAVFANVMAVESGQQKPSQFIYDLLKLIEGELAALGITVIRPMAGESPDPNTMRQIAGMQAPFWRTPGVIARVDSCGFVITGGHGRHRVLRKAGVTVYRRDT
jgi:molecular chaperone GrpE (heat shock protein)